MKIVMVDSTSYRQATRLGSHAIAREWKNLGGDLLWIGAPVYPHFLLGRRDPVIARRVEVWKRGGARDADGTLEYYPLLYCRPSTGLCCAAHLSLATPFALRCRRST